MYYYHILRSGPPSIEFWKREYDLQKRYDLDHDPRCLPTLKLPFEIDAKTRATNVFKNKMKVDRILASMIRGDISGVSSQQFPLTTAAKEHYLLLSSMIVLDRPSLTEARSKVCEYVSDMTNYCNRTMFNHCESGCKFSKDDANFIFMEELRSTACSTENVSCLKSKFPPNLSEVMAYGQKKEQVTDLQLRSAWYTLTQNGPGEVAGVLHTVLQTRDYCSRIMFNLRKLSLGTGNIYKCKDFVHIKKFSCEFNKKYTSAEISFSMADYEYQSWTKEKYALPLSDPKNYLPSFKNKKIIHEDDILHENILYDFNGNLSQEEAEQLISYLTTPYMRIPLVLDFFSRERVGSLFNEELQKMLEETLFVPGTWGQLNPNDGKNLETVPCNPLKLNTNLGYLMTELERGPAITLKSFHSLLLDGRKLAVGDYRSSFVNVLLFLLRLCMKVRLFIMNVLQKRSSAEEDCLLEYNEKFIKWTNDAVVLLRVWLHEAQTENSKYEATVIHAHIAMTGWGSVEQRMTQEDIERIIPSCSFLRTWHVSRSGAGMNKKSKAGAADDADQEDDDKKADASKHMGVCEQEMHWMIQSKRNDMLSYLKTTASDEDVKSLLLQTVQTTTSDATSYTSWHCANGVQSNSIKNNASEITTYTDSDATFNIDVQRGRLSYQSSDFSPVPEDISRTYDFKRYFNNKIPHCASLIKSENLESVNVIKGNLLIESWKHLPKGSELEILGTPTSGNRNAGDIQIIETEHPYPDSMERSGDIKFGSNAESMFLTFDPRCKTENNYDKLIIVDSTGKKLTFTGDEFPSEPVLLPGNSCHWKFTSDGGNNAWGVRVLVKEKRKINESSKFNFAGSGYGGTGRSWRYNQSPPSDLKWITPILNPIVHATLTNDPKNGRKKIQWKKFEIPGQEEKVTADKTLFLLPSERVPDNRHEVTMLMLLPMQEEWKIVKCNRLYHNVDVYTLDVFGRRGYPRLCYASDSRMSLGTLPVNANESLFPPSSITRFAKGNILDHVIGGHDVVITDQTEGEDGMGPRTYLPKRVTNGVVPGYVYFEIQFLECQVLY